MTLLSVKAESFPIRGSFTISRGSKTVAEVVTVEVRDAPFFGRGECVPYGRYGETVAGVIQDLEKLVPEVAAGLTRAELQTVLPPGAARNALDCAFWDLEAKAARLPVWQLLGLKQLDPVTTAYTLSLDTPDNMAAAAKSNASRPVLKLKLKGDSEDLGRIQAVHAQAPNAKLIVDANEAWTEESYRFLMPKLRDLGVALIEQPFPADADDILRDLPHEIPICADESCHGVKTLSSLQGKYEFINIKLDKTGGLTEAMTLKREAIKGGYQIMVGSMLATSLSMAPALILAQGVQFADLDGPLLLAKDREPGLSYSGSVISPTEAKLWG